jgi:O-antigen ligase
MSATGGLSVARPLIAFGIVLALIGIGQWALTLHEQHPLIYGFWKPRFDARPFGPFVNPNHFAGWMLMVMPLALGLCYEAVQRTMEEARMSDGQLSFAGSPEFGRALTFGFCAVAMALSLIMTRSRSGLAAFAVGSALAAFVMFRRQRSTAARITVVTVFLVLLGGAGMWAGVDTIVGKVLEDQTSDSMGGRLNAWSDTIRIIRAFPLAGTGFGTYGTAMTVYQTGGRQVHFQEAHNDYLQLAAEGGLLVGVPVLIAIGIFIREVRRRFQEAPKVGTTYWLRVGAVIGLVSIAAQSLVEFSLQMPGNAALFAALAAIALHQSPRLRSTPRPRLVQADQ